MRRKLLFSVCGAAAVAVLSFGTVTGSADAHQTDGAPVTVVGEVQELTEDSRTESREPAQADRYLLAKIAMAEAEGEDVEGKMLVIRVVLNRVASDEFPDTIEEVIYQDGQFTPITNGRFDSVEPDSECWKAVCLVTLDGWDESDGALYFESASASTWHRDNLQYLFQHGNHIFYTDPEEQS